MKYYLEIEDNGPYQPKDNWWSTICDVSGMNVDKFDLKQSAAKDYSEKYVTCRQSGGETTHITPQVNSLQKKASFCLLSHQSQDFDEGRNCKIAKPGRDSHSEPEGIKEKRR